MNLIGEYIKKYRGDISLREFAKKCNISHTHLDSIEKGYDPRTGKPVSVTVETLKKIAKAMNMTINDLLIKSGDVQLNDLQLNEELTTNQLVSNMLTETFSSRLKNALEIRNIKPAELSKKTGINKSQISHWLAGDYQAKQDSIYLLSQALNVSPVWLMGLNVPMEKEKELSNESFDKQTKKYITENGIEIYIPVDKDITADDILDVQDVLNDIRQGKYDKKN